MLLQAWCRDASSLYISCWVCLLTISTSLDISAFAVVTCAVCTLLCLGFCHFFPKVNCYCALAAFQHYNWVRLCTVTSSHSCIADSESDHSQIWRFMNMHTDWLNDLCSIAALIYCDGAVLYHLAVVCVLFCLTFLGCVVLSAYGRVGKLQCERLHPARHHIFTDA